MTEADWQVCADPQAMLSFLEGKTSDRKLRLFACACCRRFWPHLRDSRCRQAVEVCERYAGGQANEADLAEVREAAQMAMMEAPLFQGPAYAAAAAATEDDALEA